MEGRGLDGCVGSRRRSKSLESNSRNIHGFGSKSFYTRKRTLGS